MTVASVANGQQSVKVFAGDEMNVIMGIRAKPKL